MVQDVHDFRIHGAPFAFNLPKGAKYGINIRLEVVRLQVRWAKLQKPPDRLAFALYSRMVEMEVLRHDFLQQGEGTFLVGWEVVLLYLLIPLQQVQGSISLRVCSGLLSQSFDLKLPIFFIFDVIFDHIMSFRKAMAKICMIIPSIRISIFCRFVLLKRCVHLLEALWVRRSQESMATVGFQLILIAFLSTLVVIVVALLELELTLRHPSLHRLCSCVAEVHPWSTSFLDIFLPDAHFLGTIFAILTDRLKRIRLPPWSGLLLLEEWDRLMLFEWMQTVVLVYVVLVHFCWFCKIPYIFIILSWKSDYKI